MDIDPRAMPSSEETGGEETPTNTQLPTAPVVTPTVDSSVLEELEILKTKNLELQKQKEHWREKYERDITVPQPSEDPVYLTDDEVLAKKLDALQSKLNAFEERQIIEKVSASYPVIKEKADEFDEFKADYPGVALDKIAKLFIAEKGYVETENTRKGLEKTTGGSKTQTKTGLSQDEIKRLRETQPRRYEQMIRNGKINPDTIA